MSYPVYAAPYREDTEVDVVALMRRLGAAPDHVTVVVPVYNASTAVKACLDSVLRHAGPGMRMVAVDDASTEEATVALLDDYAARGKIELLRHAENQGFTRTANDGIAAAGDSDVILLNSDTEVGPLWWQRLRWVAYSLDKVATVSAMSDNAGRVSIPVINEVNEWHPDRAWDDVARLVAQHMYVWDQEWPLAAGFCAYLTRAALNEVGVLDAEAFPRGYGEEIDFARRAMIAGYTNRLAPHVLVKHARSESFGDDERIRLVKESMPLLHERYPERMDNVADWITSPGNQLVRIVAERLRTEALAVPPEPHIATVADAAQADAPALAHRAVLERVESVVLAADLPADAVVAARAAAQTLSVPVTQA